MGRSNIVTTGFPMDTLYDPNEQVRPKKIFSPGQTLWMSLVLLASWEAIAGTFAAGFTNGGPVALVYGMLLSLAGNITLVLSLAELASIYPMPGAQYYWSTKFAPPRFAKIACHIQGWITVFAWQATLTSLVYLTATQIQGVIILNYDSYTPQLWHGTLMMWAVLVVLLVINIWGYRLIPMIELLSGILHCSLFVVFVIVLLVVQRERSDAEFVFATFANDNTGWPDGVSWCVGQLTVVFCLVGFDGVIHMSDEVEDAERTIPKVMIRSVMINGLLAFAFLLVILFCIGDPEKVLNTNTGYPIIALFWLATGSKKAATAMEAGIIVIAFASGFALLASVSRLTAAFARSQVLPFPNYFRKLNPKHNNIPVRALCLVVVIVVLLSLINIGSTIALNAVLSLSTLALYVSYLVPIALFVHKRMTAEPIKFGPFNLGPYGLYINLAALAYGTFIVAFLPFPASTPVNAKTMNYAGPVFGLVLLGAVIDGVVRGRMRSKRGQSEAYEIP